MAERSRITRAWCAAAGLSLAVAGCSTAPKVPAVTKAAGPATTAVSGSSGDFAPDSGPKNPTKVRLAYAQWQEQMGQQAEARESYAKVLAAQPKNIEALLGLARLDQASGLYPDAEERLKKATKLGPKDARVLATYGNFYSAQGDWSKAVEKHQAAVKNSPDDPRYQFLLGVALARSGDTDQAFPYFIRSVGDAQAHYNIGYILFENGDRAGAMDHFNKALSLNPELEVVRTMVDRIQNGGDKTILAKGTDSNSPQVRPIPLTTQEALVPLQGNEASLPRGSRRSASVPASNRATQSPSDGLTPAQLEQMRNQQGQ
jgi:tetratricopeptide (TPR) repeat protein